MTPATELPRPKALSEVKGWFRPVDQQLFDWFLSTQVEHKQPGNLLELGAYMGKSAIFMAQYLRGEDAFTVCDLFDSPAPDTANSGERANPVLPRGHAEQRVLRVTRNSAMFLRATRNSACFKRTGNGASPGARGTAQSLRGAGNCATSHKQPAPDNQHPRSAPHQEKEHRTTCPASASSSPSKAPQDTSPRHWTRPSHSPSATSG
jgi:hypothetical protein